MPRLGLEAKNRLSGHVCIEGEQRFEINFNTRALVREVYGPADQYRRLEYAYKTISQGMVNIGKGSTGSFVRQAIFLLKATKHREAEDLLQNALRKYPNDPNLIGILGLVYKAWSPPRITDARERFNRAWQLKCSSLDMYEHWCRMKEREQEWTKAAQAAENGLKILPNNRILLYLAGYGWSRLAKELRGGLHREKAQKEQSEATRLLQNALKVPIDLDAKGKALNADIYRALVLTYEQSGDVKGMAYYFRLWRTEHPDDPDMASEWERISGKYHL